jgi:hypothetical protein
LIKHIYAIVIPYGWYNTIQVFNGDWRVHMFMAVISWNATHDEALFQLRMGGGQRVNHTANATIQERHFLSYL